MPPDLGAERGGVGPSCHRQPIRCEMTASNTAASKLKARGRFRLPDPPEREPDDMTSFDRLAENGNAHHLKQHLMARRPGESENIIVSGEHYLVVRPTRNMAGSHYPDLLVAFDVDPEAYRASNGYVISEQGKPPDLVLEIASYRTRQVDTGAKRQDYAALGIGEYWRFDPTPEGRWHGARLAGDRLVNGEYVPIEIEELADGSLQGYSPMLNLHLRWERGELAFHDPATGQPIATFEAERARADSAETERNTEREARAAAEVRAETERVRAENAEARVSELEEQLRLRNT